MLRLVSALSGLALVLAACGGSSTGGAATDGDLIFAGGFDPSAGWTLTLMSPIEGTTIGRTIDIELDITFDQAEGTIRLFADQDGMLDTPDDRVLIAEITGGSGPRIISWSTIGVPAGIYQPVALGPNGDVRPIGDRVPLIYANVTGLTSSIRYPNHPTLYSAVTRLFPSGSGTWSFYLDEDADLATTDDQIEIGSGTGNGGDVFPIDLSDLRPGVYTPMVRMIDDSGFTVDVADEPVLTLRTRSFHRCPLRIEGRSASESNYRATGHLLPYQLARGYLFSLQPGEIAHLMPSDAIDDVVAGPATGTSVVFGRYDSMDTQVYLQRIDAESFRLTDCMFHTNNRLSITGMVRSSTDIVIPSMDGDTMTLPATGGAEVAAHILYDASGNLYTMRVLGGTGEREILSGGEYSNRWALNTVVFDGELTLNEGHSWERTFDAGTNSHDVMVLNTHPTNGLVYDIHHIRTTQGRVETARATGGNTFHVVALEASGNAAFELPDGDGNTVEIPATGSDRTGLIAVYERVGAGTYPRTGVLRWVRQFTCTDAFAIRTETLPRSTWDELFVSVTHGGTLTWEPGTRDETSWTTPAGSASVQVFPVAPDTGELGDWQRTFELTGADATAKTWGFNVFRTDDRRSVCLALRVPGGVQTDVGLDTEVAYAADGSAYRANAIINQDTGDVTSLVRWIRFDGADTGVGHEPDWGNPDAPVGETKNITHAIQLMTGLVGSATLNPDGSYPIAVDAGPSPDDFCLLDVAFDLDGQVRR